MTLESELVRIQSGLKAFKTAQSSYSDSANLYKATFNPGPWIQSGWSGKVYKLTCLTTIPLKNAVFQISPQPGFSPQVAITDYNPMIDSPNTFYWIYTPVPDSSDLRTFAPSAVTIISNVPFELTVEQIQSW